MQLTIIQEVYFASKAIGKDLPRYGACTRPLIRTFSPKFFMFQCPHVWIMIEFMLWARVSQANGFCNSFTSFWSVHRIGDTLQTMLPWSCIKKKRAAHKGMEHTLECDASCIGKPESKTTGAKTFQSKMSHSLHSWSRQDGFLSEELYHLCCTKSLEHLLQLGNSTFASFARARSFFAIHASYILRMIEIQSGELCRNASYFFITWLRCPIPKQLLIPIVLYIAAPVFRWIKRTDDPWWYQETHTLDQPAPIDNKHSVGICWSCFCSAVKAGGGHRASILGLLLKDVKAHVRQDCRESGWSICFTLQFQWSI